MAKKRSLLLRLFVIAVVLMVMPFFVLAATIAVTGTVTVKVAEHGPDGMNLYLPVPALLIDVATWAFPKMIPEDELRDAREELGPYLPALEEVAREIKTCPDGVLIKVEGGDEDMRVIKDGRSFRFEIESEDADIRVSMPARLVTRALAVLG